MEAAGICRRFQTVPPMPVLASKLTDLPRD